MESFKKFIEENRDEVTALQIIYSKPYGQRHLTYEQIKQLAEAVERPPYGFDPDRVWQAYEQLDRSPVKGAGPQKLLTNLVSLVRFALGEKPGLEPLPGYSEREVRCLDLRSGGEREAVHAGAGRVAENDPGSCRHQPGDGDG